MAEMGELEKYVTELSEKTRADGEFTTRNTVEKVLKEFAKRMDVDYPEIETVYYWWSDKQTNNNLWKFLSGTKNICIVQNNNRAPSAMRFPALVIASGNDRWNKLFIVIDSNGVTWGGSLDLRNGDITCTPASYSILSSPNGTAYKITVSNDGELTTTALS